ncbi:MAG: hypothetical protein AAB197_04020 [Deltaproteobacteria bacterium]
MWYREDEVITISRQELYEKVWATPTTILAKGYGISDVALAKICKKHKIPKPPLGYWARVAAGKKVVRKPLPPIAEPDLQEVRIRKRSAGTGKERLPPETKTALAAEKAEANRIHVPSQCESPHPLVERTLKSLQSAAKNEFGLVRPKAKQCLDIAVSGDNIDRSMSIMDALVKALEGRGHPVSVLEDNGPRRTSVTVLDESVQIQLKELLDHKEKDVTPKQREDYLSWHRRPEFEYFPSGRLALCIVSKDTEGCRRLWADGTTQKVEDRLNSFIGGLVMAAEAIKTARAKREQWEKEWKEEERRRQEAERRRWQEEEKIRELEEQIASWEKSQTVRQFLSAAELAMTEKHGTIEPTSKFARWLVWGRRYADSVDPLV